MNILKSKFIKDLEYIKNIETLEFKDKAEKIRNLLITSMNYNNLKYIFKSSYHLYKDEIKYIQENYSYSITKVNEQLDPQLIIGFNHGSYNNDSTSFDMLCNAKRINYNLIDLCNNPEYYFGEDGCTDGIGYSCYSKKNDLNTKFYTVTSGAHRSTVAMILSNIFYGENIVNIKKVHITEYFVNYELSDLIYEINKLLENYDSLSLEINKSTIYPTNNLNGDQYYFNVITHIELINKNHGYQRLFTKSFNYKSDNNTSELLKIVNKNENKLICILKNDIYSNIDEYIKIENTKKEDCTCSKIFSFICKLFFK